MGPNQVLRVVRGRFKREAKPRLNPNLEAVPPNKSRFCERPKDHRDPNKRLQMAPAANTIALAKMLAKRALESLNAGGEVHWSLKSGPKFCCTLITQSGSCYRRK